MELPILQSQLEDGSVVSEEKEEQGRSDECVQNGACMQGEWTSDRRSILHMDKSAL